MEHAKIIQQIMVERNLSKQKFADILGVHQTMVSQWPFEKATKSQKYIGILRNLILSQTFYLE